jgi:hypothetical protein
VKSFICLITIIGSLSTFAVDGDPTQPCAHCEVSEVRGNQITGGLAQVSKLAEKMQSKEMQDLSNKICAELITAQEMSGENSAKVVQRILLKHLNITKESNNYKTKLTKFWNKNVSQMICTTPTVDNKYPQHVMKRVIDMRLDQQVFFNFILKLDLDEGINVNAIENGKTVVDYIDKILSDPSNKTKYVFSEIKDLREVLTDYYGAKKASDV